MTAYPLRSVLAGLATTSKARLDRTYQVAKYIDLKDNKLTYSLKKRIIDTPLIRG
jgi:hypothetical protein